MGRSPRLSLLALLLLSVAGCDQEPPYTCRYNDGASGALTACSTYVSGYSLVASRASCRGFLSQEPCPSANRVGTCEVTNREEQTVALYMKYRPFYDLASATTLCTVVVSDSQDASFTPD